MKGFIFGGFTPKAWDSNSRGKLTILSGVFFLSWLTILMGDAHRDDTVLKGD
jgi:hypothetical protein